MKCVSSNQEIFYYDFNAPSIKITQKPAFPININQYHNLEFYLLVSDKDGNSQIRIFHDLNSTQGNLVNISLYDSPQEIPYFIPISKDINVGNCPLKFFAIDDYNIYSKFVTINVSFEEFSPEYANKKRWKKIKKRSPFQLLFYAFSVGKS
ncbi:hypothetical protein TVAG_105810 [Trichomonas vaginalis G3]|uniref:Uncharacterized protein n=1 Tax=Trichomonas vaginalis (strain ATCC PRA-98 / G3) TaxID=412133 RepID=A2FLS0_TRIV3|nr:hypothetical protein TVAGG3_0515270 [Trichomonas vaginalis G3]EAX94162.1 hypothetical protein TVAG_105810 [Trichomonas vaginalis G3]KAI5518071.1 hypothetical protein TVAGG3_0515270 [Trichomonas vaginalis G3]|eukprot:XP_001307092.1 hypothetical protein [Trichomonas vaginalis G3]